MRDQSAQSVVRAAGVVVLRNRESAPEVLVVHRPHRSDWSLPKGKVDPGEQLLETAVRECIEETGLTVNLGAPLARQSYIALGRPKTVDYWVGTIRADAGFSPDQEIDEIRWIPVADASTVLTYAHDHALVLEALALPNTSPLVILRHAKAVKRSEYDGEIDALRPLTGKGRHQTQALTAVLGAYGITAVHTSTSTRCAETVRVFAATTESELHLENSLSEEGHEAHPKKAAKVVARIVGSPEPGVICSHRPVLPTIMATIAKSLGLSEDDSRLEPKLSPGAFIVIHRAFIDGEIQAVAIERHAAPLGDSEDHDLLA